MRALQVAGLVEDLVAQSKHDRAQVAVNTREQKAGRKPILSAASSAKINHPKHDTRHEVSRRARVGELLKTMAETGERAGRGEAQKSAPATIQLSDLGVTKSQSSRWQQIAAGQKSVPRPLHFRTLV